MFNWDTFLGCVMTGCEVTAYKMTGCGVTGCGVTGCGWDVIIYWWTELSIPRLLYIQILVNWYVYIAIGLKLIRFSFGDVYHKYDQDSISYQSIHTIKYHDLIWNLILKRDVWITYEAENIWFGQSAYEIEWVGLTYAHSLYTIYITQ